MNDPRIVIIDDHPLFREAVEARLLSALGGVVIVYAGGDLDTAIETIEQHGADCAILDLDLGDGRSPVTNTAELADTGVPVLIVSALADPATVRSALRSGALGFVSKQAPIEEFLDALDCTLAGAPSTSRDVAAALYADPSDTAGLSERERTAMVLYASGLKIESVARRMGVKPATAQEYIRRVRDKYLRVGTRLPTKTDIYRQAREEGLVP